MNTKVTLIWAICLLSLLFVAIMPCYANAGKSKSMVYKFGEELDRIYEMTQKDSYDFHLALELNSLDVIKESITPVYEVDLLDTAQSGSIIINPMWRSHTGLIGNGEGNVYIAKTITSGGQFGGNIMFYIEDGVAYNMMYTPSEYSPILPEKGNRYPASASYADHAKRIATALDEKNIISPYDVKYVVADMIGDFYYINNASHNVFVAVGYVSINETSDSPVDYCISETDLIDLAKDYTKNIDDYLNEKALWEVNHPGEIWDITGGNNLSPIISQCSSIENIIDIVEFFNFNKENNSTNYASELKGKTHLGAIIGLISFSVLFAVIIVFISIRIKRLKSFTKVT